VAQAAQGTNMLITFSGVDGSGKSTQVDFVTNWLQARGLQPVNLHLTQWTWVYLIGEKLGRKKLENGNTAVSTPRSIPARTLRQLVSLVDLLRFKHLWWRVKQREGILVCDRYFYDIGVNALYRQTLDSMMVNFIWKHAPQPDLAFFLDVMPEIAQQREGEHEADYYVEKRRLYLEMIVNFPLIVLPPGQILQTQAQIEKVLNQKFVTAT